MIYNPSINPSVHYGLELYAIGVYLYGTSAEKRINAEGKEYFGSFCKGFALARYSPSVRS